MTRAVLVRRLRLRRENQGRKGPGRIVLISLVSAFAVVAVGITAAIGIAFAVFQSYAHDYVRLDEKLVQTNVGITRVYDRNGVPLGNLPNPQAQLLRPVPLSQISHWMQEATVSTEDNSFWSNPGVNVTGLLRAAYENYVGGDFGSGSGGSSITQQLVKQVYICPSIATSPDKVCTSAERTLDRKLREIVYALEVEADYSKEDILQFYLNQTPYADRYVGVEAASQGYFHEPAADLTLAQAALLAGVPAAPTMYHPRLNCVTDEAGSCVVDQEGRTQVGGEAKARQVYVLDLMVKHGRATAEEAEAAKAEPLLIYPGTEDILASAFLENQVEPRLVRMCEAGLLPRRSTNVDCTTAVRSGGYKVTTTLDYGETQAAQALISKYIAAGLEANCNCHNASIVTIEPSTGEVRVYAPNIDESNRSDPRVRGDIDELVDIHQPGSSFKPAVYLAWLDKLGKNPWNVIWDTGPMTVEGTEFKNPRNDGKTSEGLISMRAALGNSQNVPAIRVADEVGVDNIIAMAKALGITTLDQNFDPIFNSHGSVQYGISIATGGANIRAVDMAYMNAVLANMGKMVGVPTLARTVPLSDLKSLDADNADDVETAREQAAEFARGNIRLEGTRELDPVVVLHVEDINGNVIYDHAAANDLVAKQVVDAGSVWLLQSVMTDCTARYILWGCGSSNDDNALDTFLNGQKIPMGVKTGTQQGFTSADDTLETWMNGFSRYAATSVWVGNANRELVNDGRRFGFISGNTTSRLFRNWMAEYHRYLLDSGAITSIENFDSLRPPNVAQQSIQTPATSDRLRGGCYQRVTAWVRTDVPYVSDCTGSYVRLPEFKPDLAIQLARRFGIPYTSADGRGQGQYAGGGDVQAQPTPKPATQPPATQPPASTPTPPAVTPAPPKPTPTQEQPTPAPKPTDTPPPEPTKQNGGGGSGADGAGSRGPGSR